MVYLVSARNILEKKTEHAQSCTTNFSMEIMLGKYHAKKHKKKNNNKIVENC